MSISTPSGGSRRPAATKATAGGKPNLDKDESTPAKAAGTRAGSARAAGAKATGAKSTTAAKAASAKAAPAKAAGDTEAAEAKTAGTKSPGTRAAGAKAAGTRAAGSKATGSKATASKATASKATASKATASKATASRPATKSAGTRPAAKAGGRRPITPVKVSQGRNWGPILLFAAAILIAVGIIGFAGWKVYDSQLTVSDRVDAIDGTQNFRESDPNLVKSAQHQSGPIKYEQNPPVAGKHNPDWQNCMGDVYDAPIASEHAVHSMEHGAVWVVYNPAKLDKAQIDALAKKVQGKEYSLMSPMENLDTAVSVQAWGFQLKTDNPADKRIDEFIKATRKNAGVEAAACSGGITETGTTPRDLQPAQQGGG